MRIDLTPVFQAIIALLAALTLCLCASLPVAAEKAGEAAEAARATEKAGMTVWVSPAKRKLAPGKTGTFTVKVKNAGGQVKYQWEFSKDGGNTWKKCGVSGNRTATLKLTAKTETYGRMYRCLVTAKNGKSYTDPVWINPENVGDFQYANNGKNQLTVKKYKKDETTVTVPAGYNGRPVTGIGAGVFRGKRLKRIVIPASVTAIGANAFEGCTALTGVTLSDQVKSIGKGAFKNCVKLTTMTIVNK